MLLVSGRVQVAISFRGPNASTSMHQGLVSGDVTGPFRQRATGKTWMTGAPWRFLRIPKQDGLFEGIQNTLGVQVGH